MAIAAYAVGATEVLYLEANTSRLRLLRQAVVAETKELLGNFKLSVHVGAGAYVCGEETALIESLEGRGEPRFNRLIRRSRILGQAHYRKQCRNAGCYSRLFSRADWFSSIGDPEFPGTQI